MKYIGIFFVKVYQKLISPLKPPCCRFRPTCSQYAVEAFSEWGFFAGLGLTLWRVLRCNPFSKGGDDPVPKRKRRDNTRISKNNEGENTQK